MALLSVSERATDAQRRAADAISDRPTPLEAARSAGSAAASAGSAAASAGSTAASAGSTVVRGTLGAILGGIRLVVDAIRYIISLIQAAVVALPWLIVGLWLSSTAATLTSFTGPGALVVGLGVQTIYAHYTWPYIQPVIADRAGIEADYSGVLGVGGPDAPRGGGAAKVVARNAF